jgi:GST-like protein
MWQMGAAPFVGGGFGHFYHYAPFRIEYAIDRYAMETKRQLHVLDTHLGTHEYLAGDEYTIADIAAFPWYDALLRDGYGAAEFLSVGDYRNVIRWSDSLRAREAVQRGRLVNATTLPEAHRVPERHEAADIDRVRAVMKAEAESAV